ncbi:hypothetical protein D3C77_558720 [compost metagenome]
MHQRFADFRLLLVVGGAPLGGEGVDLAAGVAGDGHGVAGDLQSALGDHHVATVDGLALAVVQLGAVGLHVDRLVTVGGQRPGAAGGGQAAEQQKRFSERHVGLLRWTATAPCLP